MRRSEIIKLTWDQVDLQRRVVTWGYPIFSMSSGLLVGGVKASDKN